MTRPDLKADKARRAYRSMTEQSETRIKPWLSDGQSEDWSEDRVTAEQQAEAMHQEAESYLADRSNQQVDGLTFNPFVSLTGMSVKKEVA